MLNFKSVSVCTVLTSYITFLIRKTSHYNLILGRQYIDWFKQQYIVSVLKVLCQECQSSPA